MRIVTIGEILIDLTQTGVNGQNIPVYAANPGGALANVAVAAARLGADAAFVGMVGSDGFGGYLTQVLEENGVSTQGLRVGPGATTLAVVSVNGQGERSFQFMRGADALLTADQVDEALLAQAGVVHFGSVSLTADPARTATLHAVEEARQQGAVVSYDPNYRAALWDSREEAVEWMRRPLPMVDILKLSDEEMELLSGSGDPQRCSQAMEEKGISLVLHPGGGHQRGGRYLPGRRAQPAQPPHPGGAGEPGERGAGGHSGLRQPGGGGDLLPQRGHSRHANLGGTGRVSEKTSTWAAGPCGCF